MDLSPFLLTPCPDKAPLRHLTEIAYNYDETPVRMVHHGQTVAVEYEPGSTIRLQERGPFYEIVQCHFHAPAQHTWEPGVLSEMELHIVHRSQADPAQFAVVGVMMQAGAENVVLRPVFDHMAEVMNAGDHFEDYTRLMNIADVLPADQRYVTYQAALSIPPYSGKVQWLVLREPIALSRMQIEAFRAVLPDTRDGKNRPT